MGENDSEIPEKLINMSLCKMAESRTLRRGGSTLHKQLLISTVLTRARTLYFEKWYMGDGSGGGESSNSGDLEEEAGPLEPSTPSPNPPLLLLPSNHPGDEERTSINNNHIIDPRFFVEVETEANEIDLPPDILNCVEKMSRDSFSLNPPSASQVLDDSQSPFDDNEGAPGGDEEMSLDSSSTSASTLTYLDLDSATSTTTTRSPSEIRHSLVLHHQKQLQQEIQIEPIILPIPPIPSTSTTPTFTPIVSSGTSKRRRGWSFDEDEDEEDEYLNSSNSNSIPLEINRKLKRNGVSVTNINVAKRLRISSSEFRSSRAEVEEDDDEEEEEARVSEVEEEEPKQLDQLLNGDDDEPFLCHALDQTNEGWYNNINNRGGGVEENGVDHEGGGAGKKNRDRRVPSSGSSSDGENVDEDTEMEVEGITSLIQYCSLKQQKSSESLSSSAVDAVAPCSSSVSSVSLPSSKSSSSSSTLIRSISSPDLCNRSTLESNPPQDLFNCQRRVLTMTV